MINNCYTQLRGTARSPGGETAALDQRRTEATGGSAEECWAECFSFARNWGLDIQMNKIFLEM